MYLLGHPMTTSKSPFKLKGEQYCFLENLRCNFMFYKSKNFSDSSFCRSLECENFRFPFSTKNSLTWRVKCEKLNFIKSWGIYKISFENWTWIDGHLENSRQCLLLRTDILQKTVVGCPCLKNSSRSVRVQILVHARK